MIKIISSQWYASLVNLLPILVGITLIGTDNVLGQAFSSIIAGTLIGGAIVPLIGLNHYKKALLEADGGSNYTDIIWTYIANTFGGPFKFRVAIIAHATIGALALCGLVFPDYAAAIIAVSYIFGTWLSIFYIHLIAVVSVHPPSGRNLPVLGGGEFRVNVKGAFHDRSALYMKIVDFLPYLHVFQLIITSLTILALGGVVQNSTGMVLVGSINCIVAASLLFVIRPLLQRAECWLPSG